MGGRLAGKVGQIETPGATLGRTDGKHLAHELLTPLQLLERPGTADEIAAAVLFLASGESSFITGKVLDVDGGIAVQV